MFIKVNFNGTTRKIKLEESASLEQLKAELIRCFGEKIKESGLGYNDSESELITISSQEDWDVCLEEFKEKSKGKPTTTVNLLIVPVGEDFVTIGDNTLNKTVETIKAPAEAESEIKEDPKPAEPVIDIPEDKIIVENEITEAKETFVPEDAIVETEVKVPEESFSNPEELQALIENVKNTLGSVFGCPVDVVEARVEPPAPVETEDNQSILSTLTEDQRTEIEDMIEEKIQRALNMKKEKKDKKKEKKDKKEKKNADHSFVHTNIICDGCKKGIRDMARFKSLVIDDYDLCEECEKTGIHPGPMVKFNTPSQYNAYHMNQKFREFTPFFKNDGQKKEESCEGFRMFPGCPFRGPRGGADFPHHARRSMCHIRPGPQSHRPHGGPRHPFFGDLIKQVQPFGGLFKNIIDNVTAEISKHTQAPKKPETPKKTEEPKKETISENKPAEDHFRTLAEEFNAEFSDMGLNVDVLTSIIRENQLLSKDAIMNYLFL